MHSKSDALDKVSSALRADGGDPGSYLRRGERLLSIQMLGACKGCPLSQTRLRLCYREPHPRREVPEVGRYSRYMLRLGISFRLQASETRLDRAGTASLLPRSKNGAPDAVRISLVAEA